MIALIFTPFLAQVQAAGSAVPAAIASGIKAGLGKAPASSATLSPAALKSLQQQLQAVQFAQHPQTPLQQHAPWLTHIFAGLFVLFAISLVVLLAFQTTKQEGLSGTLGGKVESAYRPRLGFDQQLQRITTFVAVGFAVMATVVSLAGI